MIYKTNIREYNEEMEVEIGKLSEFYDVGEKDRVVIRAYNEGGCNATVVDLLDVMNWIYENPDKIISMLPKDKYMYIPNGSGD